MNVYNAASNVFSLQELAKEKKASDFGIFTSANTFLKALENSTEIPFDFKWSNGTGYFDHAVQGEHAPKLGNGKAVHSWTTNGRCVMIIGTRLGNVVVFTRYDDWHTKAEPVFTFNMPTAIKQIFNVHDGALDQVDMELLVGNEIARNIGHRIEDLYTLCKRTQKL